MLVARKLQRCDSRGTSRRLQIVPAVRVAQLRRQQQAQWRPRAAASGPPPPYELRSCDVSSRRNGAPAPLPIRATAGLPACASASRLRWACAHPPVRATACLAKCAAAPPGGGEVSAVVVAVLN